MVKQEQKSKNTKIDAAHLSELLMKAEYVDRKSFYLHGFFRGIAAGAGTVLGATVVIALLLWVLSLFDTVPLIGPTIDHARQTIEQKK